MGTISSQQSAVSSRQSADRQSSSRQPAFARSAPARSRLHCAAMFFNPFARRSDPHLLAVSMTGVKMGDRVAFVGCAHAGRLAAVAARVGLSGRAVAIVQDERAAGRREKEPSRPACSSMSTSPRRPNCPWRTPRSTLRWSMTRQACSAGCRPPSGPPPFASWPGFSAREGASSSSAHHRRPASPGCWRKRPMRRFAASGDANAALAADGFGIVRTLAEREGLVFVEGIKPRA